MSPSCSVKTRSYSDSLPGLFKRGQGQGYGEFVDDDEASDVEHDILSSGTDFSLAQHEGRSDADSAVVRQSKPAETKDLPLSRSRRSSSGAVLFEAISWI